MVRKDRSMNQIMKVFGFVCVALVFGCEEFNPALMIETSLVDKDLFSDAKPFVLYETYSSCGEGVPCTNTFLIVRAKFGKNYLVIKEKERNLRERYCKCNAVGFCYDEGILFGKEFSRTFYWSRRTNLVEVDLSEFDLVIDLPLINEKCKSLEGCWIYCEDRGIDVDIPERRWSWSKGFIMHEILDRPGRTLGEFDDYHELISYIDCGHSRNKKGQLIDINTQGESKKVSE